MKDFVCSVIVLKDVVDGTTLGLKFILVDNSFIPSVICLGKMLFDFRRE